MFHQLLKLIESVSDKDFSVASTEIIHWIDSAQDINMLVGEIGTIPESIGHDTTEEKLFSKASDAILSRALREIGLKSVVLTERADSADVQAESPIHGYSLVADAKAFRMSRTAKNQKDFKVVSLSGWRQDNDFSVLCSPYYQYPRSRSQIYAQSIEHNVCLFTWEHILFLLQKGIRESAKMNLSPIWNFSDVYATKVIAAETKCCFIDVFNETFASTIGVPKADFVEFIDNRRDAIQVRGQAEIEYWKQEKNVIKNYSKQQAIEELIIAKKIDEKVNQISGYIGGLFT